MHKALKQGKIIFFFNPSIKVCVWGGGVKTSPCTALPLSNSNADEVTANCNYEDSEIPSEAYV